MPFVYVLFFVSGATALIYEVVWARMLTQIFGNTTHAIATVLSAFMGGLALGSYVLGRLADRFRNALLLYGLLEGGVGLYGLLIPTLFALTQKAYSGMYWLTDVSFAVFLLLLFGLCFAVILVPTALMGATLPMLSRFSVTQFAAIGRRIGDLYAVNTLGAVAGCALSGFWLIPELGLRGSVRLAAAGNLAIAALVVVAVACIRHTADATGEPEAAGQPVLAHSHLDLALLTAFALSGAAAMVYENAWTRALTLVIGTSTYSFTIMLTTFLVGLGVGSLVYARWWGMREVGVAGFGLLQLAISLTALATIPLFERLPFLFLRLRLGFGDSFHQFLAIQVVVAALVMLVPTLLLGATFPMVTRIYTQSLYGIGGSVGTAYASNTVGAIVGAFLGGFVSLPVLGIQRSIGAAVMATAGAGLLLVALDTRVRRPRRLIIAGAMFVVSFAAMMSFRTWDPKVMTSGVTVYASNYASLPSDALRREWMVRDDLLFYREGLTATISIHKEVGEEYLYEKTNGKVDASFGDTSTQLMLGYLPMLLHPDAKRVLVIGMGSGMTAKAVAAFPVERLEIAEIEPAVIEGARWFVAKNGRIHDDARVRFIHADGRNYLLVAPAPYDLIISEPSNPWIAGIGNLFTREYYQQALGKLRPNGIFAQWMHTYAMAPEDLRMVYRTFAEVFPDVSLWAVNDSDLILIGTAHPQHLRLADLRAALADRPAVRQDLRSLGFRNPYSVMAMYLMPKDALLRMTKDAEVNLDDFPRLEFRAPRNLGRDTTDLNAKLTQAFVVPPNVEDADPHADATGRLALALAQGYQATRQTAQASAWVHRALARSPMDGEALLLRARLLLDKDRALAAAQDIRRAVTPPNRYFEEGIELTKGLDPSEAVPILQSIRRQAPMLIEAQVALGLALLQAERFADAEHEFRAAASARPTNHLAMAGLGRALLGQAEYAQALEAFDRAAQLGDKSGDTHARRGETLMRLGRYADAVPAYREALRTNPKNTWWRLNLAISLGTLGPIGRAEAEQRYREVLALDSDNTRAWEDLHALGAHF
ncbi:MAG TPA: fused MFS/spermidine synthase [Candidatus Baltobacteraceae bacterium]|nr:fused MFS/spermidine synthase [Candidatus Baltobacteraceae bacterium]